MNVFRSTLVDSCSPRSRDGWPPPSAVSMLVPGQNGEPLVIRMVRSRAHGWCVHEHAGDSTLCCPRAFLREPWPSSPAREGIDTNVSGERCQVRMGGGEPHAEALLRMTRTGGGTRGVEQGLNETEENKRWMIWAGGKLSESQGS